jgi:regulator of protease activity HflC (stomatin/prohibitin superfamily)
VTALLIAITSVPLLAILFVAAFFILPATVRIFAEYERAIILRFGRLHRVATPGLTFIFPLVDVVYARIDMRIMTTQIIAEKSLTADTTPVDVNAVIFWRVVDARRAAIDVADFRSSLERAAQTALREIIGRSTLQVLLSNRAQIDLELKNAIFVKAEAWGLEISSIEVRDVASPEALQNAMSQQAQAEREREARIILGSAERDIAASFDQAAQTYITNPLALELRRMNILYEGLKTDNTTMIVVPSSIADALGSMVSRIAKNDEK